MATAVPVVIAGPGPRVYGGQFAPGAISGAATLADVAASGGAVGPSAISGAAALEDVLVAGGASSIPPGSVFTTFDLTSPSTGSAPFTMAHAFRQGDVPAGQGVVVAGATAQATIKNAWPDGSAKLAIIAGHASLTANVPGTISLSAGTASGGTALTTTDLQAALSQPVSIAFGAIGTASFSGSDWASPFATIVSGHRMSSWTYRKPIGADAHLVAWLEVRLYAGGAVEVLPWVENAYMQVASPGIKAGRITFTMGGTLRYDSIDDAGLDGIDVAGVVSMYHHTRVVLVRGGVYSHWLGSNPQVVPKFERAYLVQTNLVPNYYPAAIDEASLAALTLHYRPMANTYLTPIMGATGYKPDIGWLPAESAMFLVSGDPRAYKAVLASGFSLGSYCIHYRDEAAAGAKQYRPLIFADHPLTFSTTAGGGGSVIKLPQPTGGRLYAWASSHHPQPAWLAYLTSGWNWFAEELEFMATHMFLGHYPSTRDSGNFYFNVGAQAYDDNNQSGYRELGWKWRTVAMAAAAIPDAETTRKAAYVTVLNYNAQTWRDDIQNGTRNPSTVNSLGAHNLHGYGWENMGLGQTLNGGNKFFAPWQHAFWCVGVSVNVDLQVVTDTARKADLEYIRDFIMKAPIGMLGERGVATQWPFTSGAGYQFAIVQGTGVPGTLNWSANWGAAYTLDSTLTNNTVPANTLTGGNIDAGSDGLATSYWGNLQPAIAQAVSHGVPGAAEAYARMVGANNWPTVVPQFNAIPTWGVKPRPRNYLGRVAAGMKPGQWVKLNVNGLSSALWQAGATTVLDWSDRMVYDEVRQKILFIGQGHLADQKYIQYDLATNTWSQLADPPWDTGGSGYPGYDGHAYKHNAIDRVTGNHYYAMYGSSTIRRLTAATGVWDTIAPHTNSGAAATKALGWLSSIGTNGGLFVVNYDMVQRWDAATNVWTMVTNTLPPRGNNAICELSAPNNLMLFGGGFDNSLWSVGPTGGITSRASCPITMDAVNAITFTCPVSGELIVINNGGPMRKYNVQANAWSNLTFTGAPTFPSIGPGCQVMAIPMQDHGVVGVLFGLANEFWLYKHA